MEEKLEVLVVKDMVLFPNSEVRIEFDSSKKNALSRFEASDEKKIVVVNPLDTEQDVDIINLPNIGVLAEIKFMMDVPNGKTRVVLQGLHRVEVDRYIEEGNNYKCNQHPAEEVFAREDSTYASLLIKSLEKYINNAPYLSNAILNQLKNTNSLRELTDLIAGFLPFDYESKKLYILELKPTVRAKNLIEQMNESLEIIALEKKIESEVEKELTETQKEFFLREKIKVIQKELGDGSSKEEEIEIFKEKCAKLKCSPKVKMKIRSELKRYERVSVNSPELGMIRDYLDWMLNLPWSSYTKDINDLKKVQETLNSSHYALKDVKDRILEYLAVKQNTNNLRSPILCLVGPPGVGKTSLALSIAKSLGRKITKISVGGINDEAEIVGHRRTYIGSSPGRIIQGIRKAGTTNPVFIIDEIDKMRKDIKGDPASSLLEVLDPEQNNSFSDHYIEEEFDLSKVMFIATANYIDQIPYELQDRLEIIEVSSYTEYEKLDIAKKHLIPKELEEHGLTEIQVQFNDDAIMMLIRHYTKEAGVRELERVIATLLRKIVKQLLTDETIASYQVDTHLVEQFLGKWKYRYHEAFDKKQIGVVNGLAYTVFGGDILPIEVTYYKGNGNLILTGSLGEVMQESAKIALSYIKSNAKDFGIDSSLLEENDIHIHVPEGAINKDGPSAGITLTTTLISAFTKTEVASNIAMTGEITLRGNVLAIGGLKEKIIGAHRAGITKIFLPRENTKDLEEIPDDVKEEITFIFVDNYEEIYKRLFKGVQSNELHKHRPKTVTVS